MDLRTGRSIWQDQALIKPRTSSLKKDLSCEVLVVGSGITGAFCSLLLSEAGCNVVVVDKRELVSGSTPASTALIQYDLDVPLVELQECLGIVQASRAYQISFQTLEEIRRLVERLEISCGFKKRVGLYLASKDSDCKFLQKETEARATAKIPVRYLDAKLLETRFNILRPGAILSEIQYEVNPCQLSLGLLTRAAELGAQLFEKTEVVLERKGQRIIAATDKAGHRINFDHIVVACGYESAELFPFINNLCQLKSTYVIASSIFPDRNPPWPESALIWEHKNPYLYARCSSDNRIIAGGGDENFQNDHQRDLLIPSKCREISRQIKEMFENNINFDIDYSWAGTFATTEDGLPIIGLLDELSNCHFALGYGGNGITFSCLAAQIISDSITKAKNEHCALFSHKRGV